MPTGREAPPSIVGTHNTLPALTQFGLVDSGARPWVTVHWLIFAV